MINLLPPSKKQSIGYARKNTVLIRWSVAFIVSILVIAAISLFGIMYMNRTLANTKTEIADKEQQLKLQKLEDTQKRVQNISSSLKLVLQVLGKEVLFSSLLKQVGAAMPPNTVLTSLSINKLQGGIDLQIAATDYQAATQAQINLSDPNNKIFSAADIQNSQCGGTVSGASTKYPCTVTIRAQFASNNPFLFINQTGGAGASQ